MSESTHNPAMFELARDARGLTQRQLAEATHFSQGYISKVEKGIIQPTPDRVVRIADELGFPPEFFSRVDRIYGFGSLCIYHRKRSSMPVTALRTIQARINIQRMQVGDLLRGSDIQAENEFPRLDVDEYDSPENVARIVRQAWRLPTGPIENLVTAVESAGGIVMRMFFGSEKIDAISQWPPEMPPLIFINDALPEDRIRWSTAHEIGHVIMHAVPTQDMEREANRFASEFLMPAADVAHHLNGLDLVRAAELKPYWKVSMQALMMRAKQLGAISASRAESLFMELSKLNYRRSEPVTLAAEKPTVVKEMVRVHLEDAGLTTTELAQVLTMNEVEFRKIYMGEDRQLRALPSA